MEGSERHKDARRCPTSPLGGTLCGLRPGAPPSRSQPVFQQRWRPRDKVRWTRHPTSAPARPGDRILSARRPRRCRYREDTSKINVARGRSITCWNVAFLKGRGSEQAAKARNIRQAPPCVPGNHDGLLPPVARDRERLAIQRFIDDGGECRLRVFELNFTHSRIVLKMTNIVILPLAGLVQCAPHSSAVPFASSVAPAR